MVPGKWARSEVTYWALVFEPAVTNDDIATGADNRLMLSDARKSVSFRSQS